MIEMPIRTGSIGEVVGNRVPGQNVNGFMEKVAAESYRVLQPGGSIRIHSATGGGEAWVPHLQAAGFSGVKVVNGYAVGVK